LAVSTRQPINHFSPAFVHTNFEEAVTNPEVKTQLVESRDKFAMPPEAIVRAVAFAIERPADVDVERDYSPSHCTELTPRLAVHRR
jgi:NADP-dependent 3-hydroxy acid dehydrogenase YdfG